MYIAYAATASASNAAASLGARLFEALVIMIIGMSAVFLMLTISMFGMMLIGKVASPKQKPAVEKQESVVSLSHTSEEAIIREEDTEADIAAAIAVIHHIRRKTAVSIPIIKRKDI
ncbi:hypothetical protein GM182_03265 [bacterium 3DAC]|nr:hypothetical protein GM182_03265 [bacterium 3DAC]